MTRRVEAGPILVTVGALLLLASLFMDWYTPGITAWQAFEVWDVVLLVLSVGCIIAGIGLAVPDLDVVDRRWLPWAAGAVTLIALSQILDPPPAAAEQEPEIGGIFALAGAAVMIAGGLLTFGRVGISFTMEPRDPRQRVEAVDARRPADPTTDAHEPVVPAARPEPAADDPPEAEPGRAGRLFARAERKQDPPAEDAPAAVSAETHATEPLAPEEGIGDEPPKPKS